MATETDLRADVIDSRDIIAELDELRAERDGGDDFDAERLALLEEIAEDGENFADWTFGVTLIADSYFKNYARDFADGIGAVDSDAGWPACYIDWDAAADALQVDYTNIEIDGRTYWAR